MARRSFTLELLQEVIKRDGATLVGEYGKLNRESRIKFLCSCGEEYEKGFRVIFEHQACCKKCTKVGKASKSKTTCIKRYKVPHPLKNEEIKQKSRETNITKYGVAHNSNVPSVIEKRKQTINSHSKEKTQEIRTKKEITCIKNYGVSNPSQSERIKEKKQETCLNNFGVKYGTQCKEVQEKTKQTNLQKYGAERPAQSQEFQAQNQHKAYKRKEFVMPSGDIRSVQGSEPFALRDLLGAGYVEDQIKTTRQDIPRIQYDCNGKQRYYFPDIFLPHENKLIEVKSTWTFKTDWDKKLKYQKDAVEKQGYIYEIWIYNAKGVRVQSGNLLAR